MELNLIEEFLLIALDDDKGQFVTDSTHLYMGFSGAILLEMALREKISIVNDKVILVNDAYEKEMVINKTIDLIKASDKNRKVKYWVNKIADNASQMKDDTLNGLMRKGILGKEDSKILWIIPNTKYPTQNATPENKVRQRLHDVMLEGEKANPHDVMLLSLIDVSELTREAFRDKEEYKIVKKKIKAISQDIEISQAVNNTIREIQAAVMVAVMAAVIVTSTAS
jgi:golgi phosphoprotein 3